MSIDHTIIKKTQILNEIAMVYETSVDVLPGNDFLKHFYEAYEIKNRENDLITYPNTFCDSLKELSGYDVWEPIAEKAISLFGFPKRIYVFKDDKSVKEELEGPDGLAPFFFVFDMMFCEYDDFTLFFISGSNN